MKKTIFGKAAMMLLIGTVALTSCSEDFVFGYDEEWDDYECTGCKALHNWGETDQGCSEDETDYQKLRQ